MNLKVVEKEENRVVFVIEGINPAVANMMRRYAIDDVPTLAIEEVEFEKNNSALFDEVLALRLGLVPLKTDLKSYKRKEECKCEGKGCAQCTLTFTLEVKGPGIVYASDLKSADPEVQPIYEKIPLVKLLDNQEVKLIATAVLDVGKRHIKFAPGLVYYRGYPMLKVVKKTGVKKCIEASNDNLVEKGEKMDIKDITKWTDAIEEVCEKNGIEVSASEEKFLFTVESWGQLSPKEMMTEAVKAFDEKLDVFTKEFKKLK